MIRTLGLGMLPYLGLASLLIQLGCSSCGQQEPTATDGSETSPQYRPSNREQKHRQ